MCVEPLHVWFFWLFLFYIFTNVTTVEYAYQIRNPHIITVSCIHYHTLSLICGHDSPLRYRLQIILSFYPKFFSKPDSKCVMCMCVRVYVWAYAYIYIYIFFVFTWLMHTCIYILRNRADWSETSSYQTFHHARERMCSYQSTRFRFRILKKYSALSSTKGLNLIVYPYHRSHLAFRFRDLLSGCYKFLLAIY